MLITRCTDALEELMIVGLAGDFDLSAVARVRSAFHDVVKDGWTSVAVDLGEVTFLDSAGLGVLIGLHRRCRMNEGICVLLDPQPEVTRLLETSGLDALLQTAKNLDDARDLTQKAGLGR